MSVLRSRAVVGLGGSAGSIQALKVFFQKVPANSGMAYVVILHLSDDYDSTLDRIIQAETSMPVSQVTATVRVQPNHVYVIPPKRELAMVDGEIHLTEPAVIRAKRAPIDHFFRTLADSYGPQGFAVILSGNGADGAAGVKRVKETGGIVLVQEPAEAEFDAMPRNAIATGMVDIVLPVEAIPKRLLQLQKTAKTLRIDHRIEEESEADKTPQADLLREILALVRMQTGQDFSNYKRPTIFRRIARRLQIHGISEIPIYLGILRQNPEEVRALLSDMLITVTNFFRDKDAFAELQAEALPLIFKDKGLNDFVRIWSAGSATGEEAYSLAIMAAEYLSTLKEPPKLQIFASDLDEESIKKARDGIYDESITADVSPERLARFFNKEAGGYRINKAIRETILFTPHNLLRDPPFSRLDLIVCRNVLIYLNRKTQDATISLFRFALKAGGILFLGSSESVNEEDGFFAPLSKKHRLFINRSAAVSPVVPTLPTQGQWIPGTPQPAQVRSMPIPFGELHYRLLELLSPPSILVDEEGEIVHASENAGQFLRFVGGEPTRNLFKLAERALQLDLRSLLMTAKQENREVVAENVRLPSPDGEASLALRVVPVDTLINLPNHFLVVFDRKSTSPSTHSQRSLSDLLAGDKALESIVRRLEQELQDVRDRLRATLEQSDLAAQDMRASNEELQAMNEELRSASEELETGKEEMQSLNEELTTVNHELKDNVDELSRANADLQNLMSSTDIATLFLNRDLHIQRFTPRAKDIFNIIASDLGRPFDHLTHRLSYHRLAEDAAEVLQSLRVIERQASIGDEQHFLIRLSPYRTMEDRIDGVVMTFLDVSALTRAASAVQEGQRLLAVALNAAKAGVWNVRFDVGTAWCSDECFALYGVAGRSSEMTMKRWLELFHPKDHGDVRTEILSAAGRRTEYDHETKVEIGGRTRWLMEVGRASYDESGQAVEMTGITLDITERVAWREDQVRLLARAARDEEKLREMDQRKNEFLAILAHELRNPLAPIPMVLTMMRSAKSAAELEEGCAVIDRQVVQLDRIVDDLLDVSRISEGKIELRIEHVDVAEALRLAFETSRPFIEGTDHKLRCSLPDDILIVQADTIRLTQVFVNLLNNAAKFSPPGTVVEVSLRTENKQAVVRIRDFGPGIDPDQRDKIFDLFAQGERSGLSGSGLGIGLSVVKRLVQMHGGRVEAGSVENGPGSEFTVRLPLSSARVLTPQSQSAVRDANELAEEPRRILVVDDNLDAAKSLSAVLRSQGHLVRTEHDGASAIAAASEYLPDVALLDLGLPDVSGLEVARAIRQRLPHAMLVAVTGWGQGSDRDRTREAGFDYHLVKPVKLQELRALLKG